MNNNTIHIGENIGNSMLDLVERHAITGMRQKALMRGKKNESGFLIDAFSQITNKTGTYLENPNEISILLYSFFQPEEIKEIRKEFLAETEQIPNQVLFGLINFDYFALFQKTDENQLEPITDIIFEEQEKEKIAG